MVPFFFSEYGYAAATWENSTPNFYAENILRNAGLEET